MHLLQTIVLVSIFVFMLRAEALSNIPTRKVAHSLHARKIVSYFSLVSYTTSHMLEGESSFATKCETQPQHSQAWASKIGRGCSRQAHSPPAEFLDIGWPTRNQILGGRGFRGGVRDSPWETLTASAGPRRISILTINCSDYMVGELTGYTALRCLSVYQLDEQPEQPTEPMTWAAGVLHPNDTESLQKVIWLKDNVHR